MYECVYAGIIVPLNIIVSTQGLLSTLSSSTMASGLSSRAGWEGWGFCLKGMKGAGSDGDCGNCSRTGLCRWRLDNITVMRYNGLDSACLYFFCDTALFVARFVLVSLQNHQSGWRRRAAVQLLLLCSLIIILVKCNYSSSRQPRSLHLHSQRNSARPDQIAQQFASHTQKTGQQGFERLRWLGVDCCLHAPTIKAHWMGRMECHMFIRERAYERVTEWSRPLSKKLLFPKVTVSRHISLSPRIESFFTTMALYRSFLCTTPLEATNERVDG